MSIRTLKREFYIPPSKWTKANALDCVLKKYLGTRKAARERHGVFKDGDTLLDEMGQGFHFGHPTCALCKFYYKHPECSPKCPLVLKSGVTCCTLGYEHPFGKWLRTGDPEPLIRALRRAIKKQAAAARS